MLKTQENDIKDSKSWSKLDDKEVGESLVPPPLTSEIKSKLLMSYEDFVQNCFSLAANAHLQFLKYSHGCDISNTLKGEEQYFRLYLNI